MRILQACVFGPRLGVYLVLQSPKACGLLDGGHRVLLAVGVQLLTIGTMIKRSVAAAKQRVGMGEDDIECFWGESSVERCG